MHVARSRDTLRVGPNKELITFPSGKCSLASSRRSQSSGVEQMFCMQKALGSVRSPAAFLGPWGAGDTPAQDSEKQLLLRGEPAVLQGLLVI